MASINGVRTGRVEFYCGEAFCDIFGGALCRKIRSTEDAAAIYAILTDESASEAA